MLLEGMGLEALERIRCSPAGPLRLRRAWPRPAGRDVSLEYVADDGTVVAALRRDGLVEQCAPGVDAALPGLRTLVARPGARVIGHRIGRRAVVRDGETFVKALRPGRIDAAVTAARRAAELAVEAPFAVPSCLGADPDLGLITFGALPGTPLSRLAGTGMGAAAGIVTGLALRALHDCPPDGLPAHTPSAEAAVVEHWAASLDAHAGGGPAGLVAARVRGAVPGAVGELLGAPPARSVALHRDLHDGQVLIDRGGHAAFLDFDTLAAGEAALDVANLLVHLELAELLGAPGAHVRACGAAIREAYWPEPGVTRRLDAYADAARLRLVCVHAFRPTGARAALLLDRLARPMIVEISRSEDVRRLP